jgi:hypothetical protein
MTSFGRLKRHNRGVVRPCESCLQARHCLLTREPKSVSRFAPRWHDRRPMVAMPTAIREWLVAKIEQAWPEPAPVVSAIPVALSAGRVQRLASGGPFGLMFDGRLDEIDGRVALEVLENSRMSGESYFRVWDDGTIEPLEPSPWLGFSFAADSTPEEQAAAEQAYFAHSRIAYEHLVERGFLSP